MLERILKVLASNFFSLICNVLISIILSRKLGAEGRGLYDSIMVVPAIVISLANLGIKQSTVYVTGQKRFSDKEIVSTVITFALLSSVIAIVTTFIVYYLQGLVENNFLILSLAVSTIPVRLIAIYSQGIFLGRTNINKYNLITNLQSVLYLAAVVALIYMFNMKVIGAVVSVLAANSIVALYSISAILEKGRIYCKINVEILKQILKLGFAYGFVLFLAQVSYRLDVIILKHFMDMGSIGCYTAAVGLAELVWQIPTSISLVLFSYSSNSKLGELSKKTAKILRVSMVIMLICGLLVYLLAPVLLPMLYGAEFEKSVPVTRALLPGIIAAVLYKVLYADIAGMGKPFLGIKIFGIAAVINIVLNISLIPVWGIVGSAIASTCSYVFSGTMMLLVYSKLTGINLRELLIPSFDDFTPVITIWKKIMIGSGRSK